MLDAKFACGCKVVRQPSGPQLKLIYCSRHAAADALYKALKDFYEKVEKTDDNPWWLQDEMYAAEDAIALADKEKT